MAHIAPVATTAASSRFSISFSPPCDFSLPPALATGARRSAAPPRYRTVSPRGAVGVVWRGNRCFTTPVWRKNRAMVAGFDKNRTFSVLRRWRRNSLKQVAEHRDEGPVRRRHRVVRHPHRTDPCQLLALLRRRGALPDAADIERHQQVERLVTMRGEGEGSETALVRVDAQLLVQLSDQRLLRRLVVVHLASGKLPEPGHRLSCRPLGEQDPTVGIDQRHRRNEQERQVASLLPSPCLAPDLMPQQLELRAAR